MAVQPTAGWEDVFFTAIRRGCTIGGAASWAGVTSSFAYRARARDEHFASRWQTALDDRDDDEGPPLTGAQREYLRAFDANLRDPFGRSPESESMIDRVAALNVVLLEARLEPWEVLGRPSPVFRVR